MVGATSTTTTTTTTATTNTTTNMEAIEIGCQTCGIHFDSREAQRDHMRGEWHVYNLKRKMTSLPPISRSVFDSQIISQGKESSESSSQSEDEQSESDDEEFIPSRCLFCPISSTSTLANLTHMTDAHKFYIPDIEHLLDIDSFLSYLSTIISSFHECLSCGSVKSSKSALQDHMRGKGHCKLNLEDDPLELGDFWEVSESEGESEEDEGDGEGKGKEQGPVMVEGELRLPSGKILGRRNKSRKPHFKPTSLSRSRSSSPLQNIEGQPQPQPQSQSHPTAPTTSSSSALSPIHTPKPIRTTRMEHRIVPRPGTQTSLIGLSDVQQRALRATEMKIEKVETKAKKMYEAKVDRKGNKQKTFRVLSMGKKAGGLEKRNG